MHQKGRRQPFFVPQMFDQDRHLLGCHRAEDRDGGGTAGLAGDAFDAAPPDGRPHEGRARKRVGDAVDEQLAHGSRQIVPLQQQSPHALMAAMAFRHALQRQPCDARRRVFQENDHFFRIADFGECGGDPARQPRTGGDQRAGDGIAAASEIDQVGIREDGRAQNRQRGDLRLILAERHHQRPRRIRRIGQPLGQREPHPRRRIVEQIGHRDTGRTALRWRHGRPQIGSRQRIGRSRPVSCLRRFHPPKKSRNDH